MNAKKKADPEALRITMQYRARGGMVYELAARGEELVLHIKQLREPEEGWRVEASSKHTEASVQATATGSSAREALESAGAAWRERRLEAGLAAFDWTAVEKALADVRAL